MPRKPVTTPKVWHLYQNFEPLSCIFWVMIKIIPVLLLKSHDDQIIPQRTEVPMLIFFCILFSSLLVPNRKTFSFRLVSRSGSPYWNQQSEESGKYLFQVIFSFFLAMWWALWNYHLILEGFIPLWEVQTNPLAVISDFLDFVLLQVQRSSVSTSEFMFLCIELLFSFQDYSCHRR